MIYVAVAEWGEYSSYSHENIFASYSEESALNKIKELKEKEDRRVLAAKEYNEYKLSIPFPQSYSADYTKLVDERRCLLTEKEREIRIKYSLDYTDDLYVAYPQKIYYSIEEVESD